MKNKIDRLEAIFMPLGSPAGRPHAPNAYNARRAVIGDSEGLGASIDPLTRVLCT